MSTSTSQRAAMELTVVPPLIVPIVKVVFGSAGGSKSAMMLPARHIAWIADGTLA